METCIICNQSEFRPIYSGTLKKCTRCGFTTANMEISAEILKKTYNVNYFRGEEYLDYLQDKDIFQLNFEKRIGLIMKATQGEVKLKNCLEIGCAYGFFGEVLKNHFNTRYTGIDVVPEVIARGREMLGLHLMAMDYLAMPSPNEPYTDIFMWDVIEHLQHPQRFIQKAWDEMVPGGRVYITTGDIGAFLPRIQGKRWRMIHPPSHIHYFTKSTLSRLLKNHGFSVVLHRYLPVFRSLRQIFYSLLLLKKRNKWLEKLHSGIPSHWAMPLNTFDIIFVIAEKK